MSVAWTARLAGRADAGAVARLLDAFNREFDSPTPGSAELAARLGRLLDPGSAMVAVLGGPAPEGEPVAGFALASLRPSVWYDGGVAVLDELYVVPERRGCGLGGILLAAAERAVSERGAHAVEINVDGEDRDALRFYLRHGYLDREPGHTEPMGLLYRELT